ncbi:MAG: hypothetical protein ACRDHE_01425 [Ktedonobacterales bacterium]
MKSRTPTHAHEAVSPISADEFRAGDATRLYRRLRPDQRAAIGLEFLRLLRLVDDPQANDVSGGAFGTATTQATDIDITRRLMQHEPQPAPIVSAEQAARVHEYVRERHPDLFEQVMDHPVTQASLAAPGAEPVETPDQPNVKLPKADVPHTSTVLDHPAP